MGEIHFFPGWGAKSLACEEDLGMYLFGRRPPGQRAAQMT